MGKIEKKREQSDGKGFVINCRFISYKVYQIGNSEERSIFGIKMISPV